MKIFFLVKQVVKEKMLCPVGHSPQYVAVC